METQVLANKDIARSFYVQGRHVMLVQGNKPWGTEVELSETGFDRGISNLTLAMAQDVTTPISARYYLVQPVFAKGPMRSAIRLIHQAGRELIPVEPLVCRAVTPTGPATGFSQDFRFDEAFEDALRQLPAFQAASRALPLPLIDVVAMGAVYGGFAGFSRFFLRLEATAPNPVSR
ncbi:MAG: hypothetical protein ABIP81_00930 [Terriglobales bacterium]